MKCFCVLMHVFVKTCLLLKITDSCFHPQSVCSFRILEGWIEHKLSGSPFTKAGSKVCRQKNGCWRWAVASELPVVSPVWAVSALREAQQLESASWPSAQSGMWEPLTEHCNSDGYLSNFHVWNLFMLSFVAQIHEVSSFSPTIIYF